MSRADAPQSPPPGPTAAATAATAPPGTLSWATTVLEVPARIRELSLPESVRRGASVVVTAVRGNGLVKYGHHAYYFMNFATLRGLRVEIGHGAVLGMGLKRFAKANGGPAGPASVPKLLRQPYYHGFNILEQMALMTVPHTATSLGAGRFLVNLWSYYGTLQVNCRRRSVTYHVREEKDDHVLGSQQWFDPATDELYGMSYSLGDSLQRIADPYHPVSARVFSRRNGGGDATCLWSGEFADSMHDLVVNQTRQHCVVCELGMHLDERGEIIPSRALVLDLRRGREWTMSGFAVAAHAVFDPDDADVIYFSNHNFVFRHNSILRALRTAAYGIEFRGPASLYKYRLTPGGPRRLGVFTAPDLYRLTNCHVFRHRGRKLLVATGSPNYLYVADANDLTLLHRIEVPHDYRFRDRPVLIGTFAPSPDGEKLYVQTRKSFQVIDVESGEPDFVRDYFHNHSCSNHMLASSDTAW